jgi:hypothetical protein
MIGKKDKLLKDSKLKKYYKTISFDQDYENDAPIYLCNMVFISEIELLMSCKSKYDLECMIIKDGYEYGDITERLEQFNKILEWLELDKKEYLKPLKNDVYNIISDFFLEYNL